MVYKLGAPIRCAYCLFRENSNKFDILKSLDRTAPTDCHRYCIKCPNCQRYKSRHDFKDHLELCKRGIRHRFICPICVRRRVPNTDDATSEYTLAKLHMGGIDDVSSEDGDQGEIYDFPSETSAEDEESSTTEEGSITLSSESSVSAQSDQSVDSLVQEITSVVRKPKSLGRKSSGEKRKSPEVPFNDEEPAPKKRCRTKTRQSKENASIGKLVTKRNYSSDSSSSEDEIRPVIKKRRIIVSSDSEEEIRPVIKNRRIILSADDSSNSSTNGSPPLPAEESSSSVDSPVSSPRHSPMPPAAVMPQNQGRCRGRPPKRKCMRLRDSEGRFIPDPNLIRGAQRPKRKRRTELELLLSYSYSYGN